MTLDTAFHGDPRHYDRTRGLPPAVQEAIAVSLADALPAGARVLDLGAGSGRFALPLAAQGFRVVAADLSAEMLTRLQAKRPAGAVSPVPVQADACRLPFRRAAFPAAFSVHTLHLVADLNAALAEIARVVQPGGVFALGYIDHDPVAPIGWTLHTWREALARRGYDLSRPMWRSHPDIVAALTRRFGAPRTRVAARWPGQTSPAAALQSVSERLFTPYWGLPDDEHAAVVAELHRAARSAFGDDLHAPRPDPRQFVWHCYQSS